MKFRTLLFGLAGWLGCAPVPAHPPPSAAPEGPRTRLIGELVGIRMQNVNKARGHYTYHVDLLVIPASRAPDPGPERTVAGGTPAPLPVRLPQRLSWSGFTDAERALLSPDGPKHQFNLTTWQEWKVPGAVDLTVVFTGPDLAHLVSDAAG